MAPVGGVCDLCRKPGSGSSWHVLGRCEHPDLVRVRTEAARALETTVDEVVRGVANHGVARLSMRRSLTVDERGRWHPAAEGWEGDTAKAGVWPNPWYGIVPTQWLDVWCGPEAGEAKLLDQVSKNKRPRQLSDTAVRGCEAVWRVAAALRGELAKTALAREREMAAEKRRLTRKKAKERNEVERKKARERICKSLLPVGAQSPQGKGGSAAALECGPCEDC